ncbi:hypothetical protein MMC22_000552 [Lobaria immixta]|nr:hypothetical protein [Lobaria immixta]
MFKHVPWSSHDEGKSSDAKHPSEGEESLTSILDVNQRSELTLLIASATASMRKTIESNFDASATLSPDFVDDFTSVSEDDKIMNPNIDPGTADVGQYDRERKLKEKREKELSAPKLRELKAAALDFIDQWRISVIERVGSIVNSKETASSQVRSTPAPKGTTHSPSDKKINPESLESDEKSDDVVASTLAALYPPIPTPLSSLDEPTRILILHSTLLLLLSLEHYVAQSRVLLLYLTSSLKLPLKVLTSDEEKVAVGLLEAAKHMSGESEAQKKADENQQSRKWKVGLASVAGAAIIGVTGGLAAPLVAAGVGSVMGGLGLGATAAAGYLGSVAGSTMLVGGLFGAYGGRMTGQMMDNYAREVEDFAFLPARESLANIDKKAKDAKDEEQKKETGGKRENLVGQSKTQGPSSTVDTNLTSDSGVQKPQSGISSTTSNESSKTQPSHLSEKETVEDPSTRRLRVTVGITGWLTSKEEVVTPWRVLGTGSEVFALRWELEALMNLGNSMMTMVSSAAWGYAKSEMIKRTIFAELMSAMWPVALLQVSRVVDNPFSIARSRAEKAGEVLADALINKAQGERPVTLIGYSLGARVIYACLMSLARRRAFGLVESAVLIGAPTPSTTADWRVMRSVVASRLVNVYSANDYVLGFLYRTSSIQYGVAGLQKIEGLPSVENVDVSETVSGHLRYRYLVGSILKKIGFEDLQLKEVRKEEEALKKMDEEEERKTLMEQGKGVGGKVLEDGKIWEGGEQRGKQSKEDAEKEAGRMEREVKEKTEKGLLQRAREQLYISK